MCCSGPSPLDTLDTTFGLLASGPPPLALEGRTIGFRGESIGLLDLRAVMFHPVTSMPVQRAVLTELVRRARRHRGQWVVGLAGVLLPGLRGSPAGRTPDCSASAADFGTTMLTNLLQQLAAPGVSNEEVAERLLWTVVRFPEEPTRDYYEPLSALGPVHGSGWTLAAEMNLKWRIPAETPIKSPG